MVHLLQSEQLIAVVQQSVPVQQGVALTLELHRHV